MDSVIIKDGNSFVAVSLFPVGYLGWGNSERQAIDSLDENLYDFCNWLSRPLPKNPTVTVVGRYEGKIGEVKLKEDETVNVKKYAELVMQTAFSYKCMTDGFLLGNAESKLNEELLKPFASEGGIIGYASALCESADVCKMRGFIFNVYKTAKEIFSATKDRGEKIANSFWFD